MSWQETTCATRYEINITHENGLVELTNTTTETTFVYNVPSSVDGCYNISVYSLDSSGMRVGSPASTRVGVNCEFFNILIITPFCSTYFLSYYSCRSQQYG